MKDEIKEILEDYKKLAGEITEKLDNTAEYESWLIVQDYFDKLLDHITNLQEENKELKQFYKKKGVYSLEYDKETLTTMITELQDRIDKAIEYINKSEYSTIESYKHIHADEDGKVYNLDILLNILKGEDK